MSITCCARLCNTFDLSIYEALLPLSITCTLPAGFHLCLTEHYKVALTTGVCGDRRLVYEMCYTGGAVPGQLL